MNLFKSFDSGLRKKICARTPAPWTASNCQIHAARGVGGSTTMVVLVVVELCCVMQFCLVVPSCHMSYVDKYQK